MKINTTSPEKHKYLQISASIDPNIEKLHYMGELPNERVTSVAVVGTRRPSTYGIEVTRKLVKELASRGVVIISGMAVGIDAVAHKAAIEAGGITLAVQGNGLRHLYPKSNLRLAEEIIKSGGAILSEYDHAVTPRGYQFLERNRIVSGLADAVIVTEAAARSGTLNTATHALSQGKELFAVPGNITSLLSQGCNKLINNGAHVFTCIDDVLARLPGLKDAPNVRVTTPRGDTPLENLIIQALKDGSRDVSNLADELKVSASQFAVALTSLEINGIINPLGANRWMIT